ncbi:phosphotransferase [Tepiditoga spiralis]|uniref:Phosphotransferase n=1 Tax=Tepiditoga spiralis TaxID=2108365 RepID=A0A7G1G8F0_9BACT|nr:PHP domain-containing protein [Tepiditoga spiralis]BBE31686.1 phosphotransferase [Tepiditoga spiralis]
MAIFKCSFHNHTVLSPCGEITMTPEVYLDVLQKIGIDWISITDHNSAKNVLVFSDILSKNGIKVIFGIEVQTIEEVHILVYFKNINELLEFSKKIEESLIIKKYDPEKLGYQILLNENGEFKKIIETPYYGSSSKYSIDNIYIMARKYETLIVPAHIFRSFGLIKQLGIPPKLEFDAVEVKSEKEMMKAKKLGFKRFIFGNDAHFPQELNMIACNVDASSRTFEELKKSIYNNKVIPIWQR